eukprot:1366833-Rhodomonas_salina.1
MLLRVPAVIGLCSLRVGLASMPAIAHSDSSTPSLCALSFASASSLRARLARIAVSVPISALCSHHGLGKRAVSDYNLLGARDLARLRSWGILIVLMRERGLQLQFRLGRSES